MRIKNIYIVTAISLIINFSCQEEDFEFGAINEPTNINISYEIVGIEADNPDGFWYKEDSGEDPITKSDYDLLSDTEKTQYVPVGDGSGLVNFKVTADEAITYRFVYNENIAPLVTSSGEASIRFTVTGLQTYTVTVIASGKGGVTSSESIEIRVLSTFEDLEAIEMLTGGLDSEKKWYVSAAEPGHIGVGPAFEGAVGNEDPWWSPHWYSAGPWAKYDLEKDRCLYEAELTFSQDSDGGLFYQMSAPGDAVYFNTALESVAGGSAGSDNCYEYSTPGVKPIILVPVSGNVPLDKGRYNENGLATQINITDEGFMAYYIGSSQYEILEISETRLHVRSYMPVDPILAWYLIFTTDKPVKE